MQIGLGIVVIAADGDEVGRVRRLIVDPASNTLSHIVVAGPSLAGSAVAVPVWAVARAEDGEVSLEVDGERVSRFPRYADHPRAGDSATAAASLGHEPGEFPSLFPEDGSLPAGAVDLGGDTEVRCGQQTVGTLSAVFADDYTAEVAMLVVRLRGEERSVDVPMTWARRVRRRELSLECSPGDVESLPDTVWQPNA